MAKTKAGVPRGRASRWAAAGTPAESAAKLLSAKEELAGAGIVLKDGAWHFGGVRSDCEWPKIAGKRLKNFPSRPFNRANGVGGKCGTLFSKADLAAMFRSLGMKVATDAQEKAMWRDVLLSERDALARAGIVELPGGWSFAGAKGTWSWPRVGGRKLGHFPNAAFNKSNGVGTKDGSVSSRRQLRDMFRSLGLRVTEDEDGGLFCGEAVVEAARRAVADSRPSLAKVNVVEIGGVWYFGDAKGRQSWPKVGGVALVSFPHSKMNKKNGVGTKHGTLSKTRHLREAFRSLGLRVATDAQEKARWARMIEGAREELAEVGVVLTPKGWEIREGARSWGGLAVGGKTISSFPNSAFNRAAGVSRSGMASDPEALGRMFRALGLKVAAVTAPSKREDIGLGAGAYAAKVRLAREELAEAGIVEEAGIWHFGSAAGRTRWPKIGPVNLCSFPYLARNRSLGIGTPNGQLSNPDDARLMFKSLGLRVATDAQERARWARTLEGAREALAEAGIVRRNGAWDFSAAERRSAWPDVGGRRLWSFPSLEANRKCGVGNRDGTLSNKAHLRAMFESLGLKTRG